jgi:sec-independent protein translocase protein TatB
MLDFNAPEFLVVAIVALIVIGPKDLPKAMRFVGQWVGKARGIARQFRSGFDSMVREAELAEMEKKWAEENERIMREHPLPQLNAPAAQLFEVSPAVDDQPPVTFEQPEIHAAPEPAPAVEATAEPAAKPKRKRTPKPKDVAAS